MDPRTVLQPLPGFDIWRPGVCRFRQRRALLLAADALARNNVRSVGVLLP